MSMKKATIQIRGVKPLIWHAFTADVLAINKKAKEGVTGNNPSEWKTTVLFDEDKNRQLYVLPSYAFGSIREGAKHVKVGKGTYKDKVAASLQVIDDRIYINRHLPDEKELSSSPKMDVYLDICSVKNPATKGRNMRYRVACSPGWEATFQIKWKENLVSEVVMKQVIEEAGELAGWGDGRSIGNGRFEVLDIKFELIK